MNDAHTFDVNAKIITGHSGRIGRALASHVGDRGCKPWLSETNDLSN